MDNLLSKKRGKACVQELDSSFKAWRLNNSTFVIQEFDQFGEHPLIYVKLFVNRPIVLITDTGCDSPDAGHKNAKYVHLREFLETYRVESYDNSPLNPNGCKQYYIVCTHCHYDHTLGIPQFISGGTTEIIASAAGRDFIESDLERHGIFDPSNGVITPNYEVTHWAQAFERLYTLPRSGQLADHKFVDLGITFIQTPGHTPDSLAWYDHKEMHLYVGDTLYEAGKSDFAIIWPNEGNMIEWLYSMLKLQAFVASQNARAKDDTEDQDADGWVSVTRRVKLAAGHSTTAADAAELLEETEAFWWEVLAGKIPVVRKFTWRGEENWSWKGEGRWRVHMRAPVRLVDEAREFFRCKA